MAVDFISVKLLILSTSLSLLDTHIIAWIFKKVNTLSGFFEKIVTVNLGGRKGPCNTMESARTVWKLCAFADRRYV